jgi:hypothetical protein
LEHHRFELGASSFSKKNAPGKDGIGLAVHHAKERGRRRAWNSRLEENSCPRYDRWQGWCEGTQDKRKRADFLRCDGARAIASFGY